MREQEVNKSLQKVIAKTIAGFMNSEGGTLLIGVTDEGAVCGIGNDIMTLHRKDRDGFEQHLVQTLSNCLGPAFGAYYRLSYDNIDGKTVCTMQVDRSPTAVFLHDNQSVEFYIRTGNTTRPLDAQAQFSYIGMHWESQ
jgi:predicted HTH transcriptional regulator